MSKTSHDESASTKSEGAGVKATSAPRGAVGTHSTQPGDAAAGNGDAAPAAQPTGTGTKP